MQFGMNPLARPQGMNQVAATPASRPASSVAPALSGPAADTVRFSGSYPTRYDVANARWQDAQGDVLIVPVYENKRLAANLDGQLSRLDSSLGNEISAILRDADEGFSGKAGDVKIVRTRSTDGLGVARVALVGIGGRRDASEQALTRAIETALKSDTLKSAKNVAIALPQGLRGLSPKSAIRAGVSAVDNLTYRSLEAVEGKGRTIKAVTFLSDPASADLTAEVSQARAASKAVALAKDLANSPYNELSAAQFAQKATDLAVRYPNVSVEVQGREWVEANMPAFYAVGKGANAVDPPQFIKLTYKPEGGPVKPQNKIAILGKSIMYDTGGVQDKALHMNGMNKDMTGGAYAMALMQALGELQPEGVEVSVYLPACANRDGAEAYLPSDVLKTANGDKKIFVQHTDAEGRVTLFDAAAMAAKDGYKQLISVATLTGDALNRSPNSIALVSSQENQALRDALLAAAKATGEAFTDFPLNAEDFSTLAAKTDNAHYVNQVPGYKRGLESGGAFIQKGIPDDAEGVQFVHCDIAPVIAEGGMADLQSSATGVGVKTLLDYILSKSTGA